MTKPHKKLTAWQKAMTLVEKIYQVTRDLPREEIYGLQSQIRRAVVSVPSNIAEGHTREQLRSICITSPWPRLRWLSLKLNSK